MYNDIKFLVKCYLHTRYHIITPTARSLNTFRFVTVSNIMSLSMNRYFQASDSVDSLLCSTWLKKPEYI